MNGIDRKINNNPMLKLTIVNGDDLSIKRLRENTS